MQQDSQSDTPLARRLLPRHDEDRAFASAFERAWQYVRTSTALGTRASALADMLEFR
jgi:hypothetical protein